MSLPFVTRLPIDGAVLEIWAHPIGASRWDAAIWGSGTWSTLDWRDVTCQITACRTAWGANRALGLMSVAAGGALSMETYDPDRILDPSNTESPFAGDVRPGAQVRLRYLSTPLAYAVLDEIDYSIKETTGRIQGTDAVGLLLNVSVTAPVSPAGTLRALARQLLALTGYQDITVEADPPEGDVAVGAPDTPASGLINVWRTISDAAVDALFYAWIGADLVMHFRSHGEPVDNGLTLGLEGIPVLEQISHSNADGIYNRVKAKDTTGPTTTLENQDSILRFGLHELDRTTRKVPSAATWASRVLEDRKLASLEYLPAQVIPCTPEHLLALASMGGIDLVRIRLDVPEPDVSVDVRSLGLQLDASPDGWAASVLGYISSVEWTAGQTPPPIEPPVEPPVTQTVVRTYTSTKASRVSLTSGGAKYGSGAEAELPVGYHSGWKDRALIGFSPELSDATEIVSAVLRLRTSTQVNTGFGSSPKVRIQRLIEGWSEGSLSSPGSGNAVVWPGPSATATGERTPSITGAEDAQVEIDVTAIVRSWAPGSAGGSGVVNYGLRIVSYDESSTSRTTEFLSDDTGTASKRPTLIVTLKVPV